ncbi:TPA: glycoside hydrolase family 32 [Enterococcus faecium]|nr:glycoside hydrolase family 32 [Enterococcus faecium]
MQKIFYKPKDFWFGDCMPFYKDGTFYLFHQRDTRNPKPLTDPFGWSLVTTTDFVKFEEYGEVIHRGGNDDIDQYIYAGSIVEGINEYLALYTGHNRKAKLDGKTSEVLMIASSKDLIHWKKDGEAAKLVPQEGYDKNDWRDPFAIFDQDHGKYVLILGARKPASKKKPTGRLVYFESEDLKDWNFKGDYWANNEFNMIEMPDIFEIDGTWYLLFSEYCEDKKTKYRVGAGLFSDWKSPVDEAFDGKAYYAARTVGTNETGRFLTGWVATKEGENDQNNWDWGGALVPHQIIQKTDKTLGVKLPEKIIENFKEITPFSSFKLEKEFGKKERVIVPKIEDYFLFETTLTITSLTKEFALKLFVDSDTQEGYEFRISLINNQLTFGKTPNYPWPQMFDKGLQRPLFLEIGKEYELKLIVDDTIAVLYIDNVALSTRMYDKVGTALSMTVTEGAIKVDKLDYSINYECGF